MDRRGSASAADVRTAKIELLTAIPARRGPSRARAALRRRAVRAAFAIAFAVLVAIGSARAQTSPPGSASELPRLLERLEALDPAAVHAAYVELARLGPPAAEAAVADLGARPLEARRARARLVREVSDGSAFDGALRALDDPDAEVRRELATAVGYRLRASPAESPARIEAGCSALASLARRDPERELRALAIEGLARCDDARAVAALLELLADAPAADRAMVARGLAAQPRAREEIVARVQRGFSGPEALPIDVLAVLMAEAYGPSLAELPAGGTAPKDRAPFALGLRHFDPAVAAATRLALERFLARLRFLGEVERGDALLAGLCGQGLGDDDLELRRATLALESGQSARQALAPIASLCARLESVDQRDPHRETRLATARILEGAAHLALGDSAASRAALAKASRRLDALWSERPEYGGESELQLAQSITDLRGLAELYGLLAAGAEGPAANADEIRARAREVHEHSLRAQLLRSLERTNEFALTGDLDELLQHPLGPLSLLFTNLEQRDLPRERVLALARALGEALATAAPREMLGFGPARERSSAVDPSELDLERWELLRRILAGEKERILAEARQSEPGSPDFSALENMMNVLAQLSDERERGLLRLRLPSSAALQLANDLREDGRASEARELAARLAADLGASEVLVSAYREQLVARALAAVGSSYTDEEKPEEAEKTLLSALERFEAVERGLDTPRGDAQLRALRSNVLISLAVNANVKLRDPAKALGYFERAYELRQDDFTRTLLACYRARAGRAEEARAALRETPVSPFNYYNLACTYALLGEKDAALEFLRREFTENHPGGGSRARQQEWARKDPDLASLRGDARFEALLR
jgi:hypothetical protein